MKHEEDYFYISCQIEITYIRYLMTVLVATCLTEHGNTCVCLDKHA